MSRNIVISCFDLTCAMLEPWAAAGYECHAVDIQHPAGQTTCGNITRWGMDVYDWERMFFQTDMSDAAVVFASFFPPCTDLAVSGARWFKKKEEDAPGTRERAMALVYWSDKIGRRLGCPYFIENPVSVISSEWRKCDFSFHPYEYGGYPGGGEDGYTKKTCLWTGGGFQMPPSRPIDLDPKTKDRIWKCPPGPDRQNIRSQTPRGFARAIFEKYAS